VKSEGTPVMRVRSWRGTLVVPVWRGVLVTPAEVAWIIQPGAPDVTSTSLPEADLTSRSFRDGDGKPQTFFDIR